MLLSSDKRLKVVLAGNYRGLSLFQPVDCVTSRNREERSHEEPKVYSTPQHNPKRSNVRELVLK